MTTQVDISAIQAQLYEKLKSSGWAAVLQPFLLSAEFTDLLNKLHTEKLEDRRFTPLLRDVFTPFYTCPVKDLHTVLIAKEPFLSIGESNGIAFDCSNLEKENPWTTQIFDAINRTVYPADTYDRELGLTRWSEQGILILTADLTVQLEKSGSHNHIWKPFTAFLLDTLNTLNSGLHFVFIGEDVKYLTPMVNIKNHYKFFVQHPRTFGQNKGVNKGIWDSENIFPILQKSIQKNYNKKIIW